jgi:hypothetical protein
MPVLSDFLSKRIPTILGILFLVAGLGVGIFIVGQGTGGFLPKASPETTPKNVKTTNISDTSFSVSFVTDSASPGYVKYGTDPKKLSNQTSDDRDQLSGQVGTFTTHHITLRSLTPSTTYYFAIGTAAREIYTDNDKPFEVKTAPKIGAAPEALTIYGSVITKASTPASDSIVYVSVDGSSPLSTLVKSSGSWAVPLSTARTTALNSYMQTTSSTVINILVQGKDASTNATALVTVAKAQPVPTITLGQTVDFTADSSSSDTTASSSSSVNTSTSTSSGSADTSRFTASQLNPVTESSGSAVASLGITFSNPANDGDTLNTQKPAIKGKAPAKTQLSIEIHSEQVINGTTTTDANGNWTYTPPTNLDPGDHTITVSYTDANGQQVSQTRNFTVLAMGTSTNPAFTSTPSATPTPTPKTTTVSTSSARTTTVATSGAIPKSGSVSETIMMIGFGLAFMLAGLYSWFKATGSHAEVHVRRVSLDGRDSHTVV